MTCLNVACGLPLLGLIFAAPAILPMIIVTLLMLVAGPTNGKGDLLLLVVAVAGYCAVYFRSVVIWRQDRRDGDISGRTLLWALAPVPFLLVAVSQLHHR